MICRPKNGLEITDDCVNIFLFYQCVNEMVFDYSPDTYKAKTLNVHSLCRELLMTYNALCQTGTEDKYYKKYITIVVDELIESLKDDIPAKDREKLVASRYHVRGAKGCYGVLL